MCTRHLNIKHKIRLFEYYGLSICLCRGQRTFTCRGVAHGGRKGQLLPPSNKSKKSCQMWSNFVDHTLLWKSYSYKKIYLIFKFTSKLLGSNECGDINANIGTNKQKYIKIQYFLALLLLIPLDLDHTSHSIFTTAV